MSEKAFTADLRASILQAELSQVKEQRDALLAACEAAYRFISGDCTGSVVPNTAETDVDRLRELFASEEAVIKQLLAAIDKAKETRGT